ncbi:hypothetical protein [Natrinema sp. DC36]|uniref:hypothetical protein n=1 Tax=Natrinema sp. DC36 TaxID=2878680 RepID=UPI001CF05701|nr:hypothetical protein [Natrinema sp. DC36]
MNGLLFALVAIGTAFYLSGALYDRRGDQSITVSAATGLTSNVIYSTAAIALILSSAVGDNYALALAGVGLLILMLFLARGNLRLLKESNVRAKIAGQA